MQFTTSLILVAVLIVMALMAAYPMFFFVWLPAGLAMLTIVLFAWYFLLLSFYSTYENRQKRQVSPGTLQQQ